jgi:GT2 family glycosyltransferase
VFAGTRIPDEVIVVDNDPLASVTPDWPEEWPIRLVHAGLGLNLPGARNRGWRAADADLCIFVDDDNTVGPDTLLNLTTAAVESEAGLLGPVIYRADSPKEIWCGGVRRSMWTSRTTFLYRGSLALPLNASWPTDDMPDAFAVPRQVLDQLGGFDEVRFPFHYDEADLGERIRRIGLQSLVVRSAAVWHAGGTNMDPGRDYIRAYELHGHKRVELMVSARVAFHRLYSNQIQKVAALGLFIPIYTLVLAIACLRVRGAPVSKLAVVRAIFTGLFRGYRVAL